MFDNSKSQLAKLMATENITVEQRKATTASFDLKNRVLVIPILKSDISPELADLFVGHEVSHALDTPLEGWHHATVDLKIPKSIVNVCEDARIEKRIKRKFPGLKASFVRGYKEILEMDFFDLQGRDVNEFNLIDRINLETKCGIYFNIDFTDEEMELLDEVEVAETWEETLAAARKIYEFMKAEGTKDFDYGEIKCSRADNGEGINCDRNCENCEYSYTEGEGEGNGNCPDPVSETDEAFRQREKELYAGGGMDRTYVDIPELKLENVVVSHKEFYDRLKAWDSNRNNPMLPEGNEEEFYAFRKSSSKTVSYLVKEFELRKNAAQMAKAQVAKTGDLNMSKVYSYKFSEDIFKRLTVVPNGKSHGLIMYIDWSGSMSSIIHETIKQMMTLVFFCKKVNIPFEVYAFSSQYTKENQGNDQQQEERKDGDLLIRSKFYMINMLSSSMSASEFKYACLWLYGFFNKNIGFYHTPYPPFAHLGGTPLNEAILAGFDIIPKFRKEKKLDVVNLIILTDGEGHQLNYYLNKGIMREIPTRSEWIMRDAKTKQEQSTKNRTNIKPSVAQTRSLLNLLKLRTKAHIIGFYIMTRRHFRFVYQDYMGPTIASELDDKAKDFNKIGSHILTDVGYDDYYLLRSDKLAVDDEDFGDVVVKSTTTKGLVKEFTQYHSGKLANKIILNRFIGMIA